MAIMINDMKMPTRCADCPLWNAEQEFCVWPAVPLTENPYGERKLDECPLEEPAKVLYLCDRRDPTCISCNPPCNATKNVEHAVGFVRSNYGTEYVDERIYKPEYQRPYDEWEMIGRG